MKILKIKKELGGRLVYFIAYYECGKWSNEIQIRLKIPHVRHQSCLSWKFETKDIHLLDTQINSCHDKQKVFTEGYFNKFVDMFMKAITKKNALLLVSEDTKVGYFFGTHYQLDEITSKTFFSDLRYNDRISHKLKPFSWRTKIKAGLEPIKVSFPYQYERRGNIELEILKNN